MMIPLFLGLTFSNLIALLLTIGMGYYAATASEALRGWHMLIGVMTLILCIAVHCIVFTYFMATAKWIQHAVSVKGLDAAYLGPTRSFKHQAFPAALGAILAVFIAAIFGAATDNKIAGVAWHHMLALTAFAINVAAAVVEYLAISRNGRLIDQILADLPPAAMESRVV